MQKTAYEMRISDWSSDVCSSDLAIRGYSNPPDFFNGGADREQWDIPPSTVCVWPYEAMYGDEVYTDGRLDNDKRRRGADEFFAELDDGESLIFYYTNHSNPLRSEEHTSELQSLMRISYAVFCLKKNKTPY